MKPVDQRKSRRLRLLISQHISDPCRDHVQNTTYAVSFVSLSRAVLSAWSINQPKLVSFCVVSACRFVSLCGLEWVYVHLRGGQWAYVGVLSSWSSGKIQQTSIFHNLLSIHLVICDFIHSYYIDLWNTWFCLLWKTFWPVSGKKKICRSYHSAVSFFSHNEIISSQISIWYPCYIYLLGK